MKKTDYTDDSIINSLIEDNPYLYHHMLNQYGVLSNDEQLELLRQYREEGNKESFQKLIYHNLGLVFYVAKENIGSCYSMSFMDLVQEGCIAIMRALDGYDFSNGVKLSTYMGEVISNNMQRQMEITDTIVRRPSHLVLKQKKFNAYRFQYFIENGKYPTEEEIEKNLQISKEMYKYLTENAVFYPTSLNKEIKNDDESTQLQDFIADEEDKYSFFEKKIDTKAFVVGIKEILSNKEYYVIFYRIINDPQKTSLEIANDLGITRSAVDHVEKRALKKLKSITKHKYDVFSKYIIKEIEEIDISPVSPIKLSVYKYLKNNLDPLTYYFIYTKREKNYDVSDYKREFSDLTEEEIKEFLDYCDSIANQVFTQERSKQIYNRAREKENLSRVFEFNIEPTTNSNLDVKEQVKTYLRQKNNTTLYI